MGGPAIESTVLAEKVMALELVGLLEERRNGEMDRTAGHGLHDVGAGHDRRQERRLGMAPVEFGEGVVEKRTRHVARHREMHGAREIAAEVGDQQRHSVDAIGDFARFAIKHLAGRGEGEIGRATNRQLGVEALLKLLQCRADRRLASAQDVGRS
jgi:hypothetical protein